VLHGHFYQPPREDPWLEEVEAESSAAPFHDWNERIEQECYRAVVAARIPASDGRIARLMNTLEWMSFNFGPTLLEWMEQRAPDTYQAVLEADRISAARTGHGNAIAMPYHHVILPLSDPRDRQTEIRWGIQDFRRRFGREPEGIWLPEAAVDHETLESVAAENIRFTVLGPHQVRTPPRGGLPGWYRTRNGGRIAVFIYDGGLSHDVAFGPLVRDAEAWVARLLSSDVSSPRELVSLATDGETFGHHHKFGEMALARVLERVQGERDVRLENFAAFLARHPPAEEITLVSPSSWSCQHGVDRWRADCGCRMAPDQPTQQRWRAPLRDAVSWLGRQLHGIFEREGAACFADPWAARDAYGAVVGARPAEVRASVAALVSPGAGSEALVRAGQLLEMERGALRTFTSCAWFFDDIGGIETIQVLRYAARAIELAGAAGADLGDQFARRLEPAHSNDPALGSGADLYRRFARPAIPPQAKITAGLAAAARYAPDAASSPAWRLDERSPDSFELVHERTGARRPFTVSLAPAGLRLTAAVSGTDLHEPVRLRLLDLPEHQREAVTAVIRSQLVDRWFTPAERARLASGEHPLREELRHALDRAVANLRQDRSLEAIRQVLELIELCESIGMYPPFDAQTAWYRLSLQLPGEEAARLHPVGIALGFA
jgi:alpha-amylase/alpha-mannosidase (GH57 family)